MTEPVGRVACSWYRGSTGRCGRWALSYVFNSRIALLPLGTLLCNLLGGLLIGALTAWFSTHLQVSPMWRLFLVTGLLGGLTTFSTFSAEGVQMMMAGDWMRALAHSCLHLFGSFAATAVGCAGSATDGLTKEVFEERGMRKSVASMLILATLP